MDRWCLDIVKWSKTGYSVVYIPQYIAWCVYIHTHTRRENKSSLFKTIINEAYIHLHGRMYVIIKRFLAPSYSIEFFSASSDLDLLYYLILMLTTHV